MCSSLPLLQLDSRSVDSDWKYLEECIINCDYVSIDLELSGLGNRKRLQAKSIEERYNHLIDTSSTHSVVSLGISCFQWVWSVDHPTLQLQLFDIILHSTLPYLIEPNAVRYLTSHGFDFNSQYRYGISYTPSHTAPPTLIKEDTPIMNGSIKGYAPIMSRLIRCLIKSRKPLIVHNGFVDLVFLYSHFYSPLPSSLGTFVADLSEMFSAGIYDTKYIAEFGVRMSASFLEYILHKSMKINEGRPPHSYIHLLTPPSPSNCHYISVITPSPVDTNTAPLCNVYANWGHCSNSECNKSHNIHDVLEAEETSREGAGSNRQKRKKRKRKREDKSLTVPSLDVLFKDELSEAKKRLSLNNDHTNEDIAVPTDKGVLMTGHRAGVDAFSTGYCFMSFALSLIRGDVTSFDVLIAGMEEYANKVPLGPRKPMPLIIMKSQYSHTSEYHRILTTQEQVNS